MRAVTDMDMHGYAMAFAPGHITGFVEFPTFMLDDPLLKGSRGAGVCITRGVTTEVHVSTHDGSDHAVNISINGKHCTDAEVSLYVVKRYLTMLNPSDRLRIDVRHRADIPVGYGLGSSGAAALSLSYALNSAMALGLSREEAARIAHEADVACRCGAGTVIAEYHGGLEMRLKAGAPGIGVVESILPPADLSEYRVLILCISPYSTREFLTNRIGMINGLGGKMLSILKDRRSVDTFLDLSYRFSRSIGFITARAARVIDALSAIGCRASVALFGETIFTIVNRDRSREAESILACYRDCYDGSDSGEYSRCYLLSCDIDTKGAIMLDGT